MPLVCMGFVFPGDLTCALSFERLQCMLPRLAICHAGCDGRCQGCNPVLFCSLLLYIPDAGTCWYGYEYSEISQMGRIQVGNAMHGTITSIRMYL